MSDEQKNEEREVAVIDNRARIFVGEFILADADGDYAKAESLLKRVGEDGLSGTAVLVTAARLAAEALQMSIGDQWREQLNVALLGLSVGDES